jgi:hypothetical protein
MAESLEVVQACDYMLSTILKRGSLELIWLVENDRIDVEKAYEIVAVDQEEQINVLEKEYAENGWVRGMTNPKDLFLIPNRLWTVDMVK